MISINCFANQINKQPRSIEMVMIMEMLLVLVYIELESELGSVH